ncbi:zinc-finger homeodomain protein 2-like [Nannospalax galili]|uniref:zinc-finger homeodomain protein 2-like n=1 Tax=Nannospalax galili TaxID=1026970 RepID=UPI00111C5C85|nr:zinc-finger homeodomain protein 2-like [Nannospalax galili]
MLRPRRPGVLEGGGGDGGGGGGEGGGRSQGGGEGGGGDRTSPLHSHTSKPPGVPVASHALLLCGRDFVLSGLLGPVRKRGPGLGRRLWPGVRSGARGTWGARVLRISSSSLRGASAPPAPQDDGVLLAAVGRGAAAVAAARGALTDRHPTRATRLSAERGRRPPGFFRLDSFFSSREDAAVVTKESVLGPRKLKWHDTHKAFTSIFIMFWSRHCLSLQISRTS